MSNQRYASLTWQVYVWGLTWTCVFHTVETTTCSAGSFMKTASCVYCALGSYGTASGYTQQSQCTACGTGKIGLAMVPSSASVCTPCPAGTIQRLSGVYSSCLIDRGYFMDMNVFRLGCNPTVYGACMTASSMTWSSGTYTVSSSTVATSSANRIYATFSEAKDPSFGTTTDDSWTLFTSVLNPIPTTYIASSLSSDSYQASGEWIQLKIPTRLPLYSYTIRKVGVYGARAWLLCGSNDAIIWKVIDSKSGYIWTGDNARQVVGDNEWQPFSYFRLIVTEYSSGQAAMVINELILYAGVLKICGTPAEDVSCTGCALGWFSKTVGVNPKACYPCPQGTYGDETFMSTAYPCKDCGSGTFAPTEGQASCTPRKACIPGVEYEPPNSGYSAWEDRVCMKCLVCPDRTTIVSDCNQTHDIQCAPCVCPPGTFMPLGVCTGSSKTFDAAKECAKCMTVDECTPGQSYLSGNCSGATRAPNQCITCAGIWCDTSYYVGICQGYSPAKCIAYTQCGPDRYLSGWGLYTDGKCVAARNCTSMGLPLIKASTNHDNAVCGGDACNATYGCTSTNNTRRYCEYAENPAKPTCGVCPVRQTRCAPHELASDARAGVAGRVSIGRPVLPGVPRRQDVLAPRGRGVRRGVRPWGTIAVRQGRDVRQV